VVGAANIDIVGTPDAELVMGDSNPGKALISLGGVGRNIAENIVRLSCPVKFITVLGQDIHADNIRRSCLALGIDVTECMTLPGARTSTYICVNRRNGDALAAIIDMGIYDKLLTPDMLEERLPALNAAAMVILDTNLSEASLAYLAGHITSPIFCDPVSVSKTHRMKAYMNHFTAIKPSRMEAEELLGLSILTDRDVENAARMLYDMGARTVFISLGSEGAYCYDGSQGKKHACCPGRIINTNGCGDAFSAAAAVGFVMGKSAEEQTMMGLAAASLCAESPLTVTDAISMTRLMDRMEEGSHGG
jgi:pseudouridine kinase